MYNTYRNTSIASFSSADSSNYEPNMSTQSLNSPDLNSPGGHEFWSPNGANTNGNGGGNPNNEISLPVQSLHGIVTVFQFTPYKGEASARITVNIGFRQLPGRVIGLRVVFGGIGLRTLVAHGHKKGHWQLRADIPDMASHGSPSQHKLSIEALEGDGVIDAVQFGTFTFYEQGAMPLDVANPSILSRRHRSFDMQQPSHLHRSSTQPFKPSSLSATLASAAAASAPVLSHHAPSSSPPTQQVPKVRSLGGHPDAYRIVRRTEIPMEREATALAVVLNIHGDVRSMSSGWSAEELACRRRLVQFWRHTEGNVVNVHFCSIKPEEYDDSRVVVSCIYREDVDKCYITSFDLIRLLEGIIGTVCNIDEKNRIRRNVHHIEHDTISKSKPYHEEFFDLLMSFPVPMPRRNVRDLKAFRWEFLPEALHAIIDKMALDYNPKAVSEMIEPSIPEVAEPTEDSFPSYATSLRSDGGSHHRGESVYSVDSSFSFANPANGNAYAPSADNSFEYRNRDAVDSSFSFRRPSAISSHMPYNDLSPNASVASFHSHQNQPMGNFNTNGSNHPYGNGNLNASASSHHFQNTLSQSPSVSVTNFNHHQSPSVSVASFHGNHPVNHNNGSQYHLSHAQSPTDQGGMMATTTPSPDAMAVDGQVGLGNSYEVDDKSMVFQNPANMGGQNGGMDGSYQGEYYAAAGGHDQARVHRMTSQSSLTGALANFYPY
ncbi:hypothetical protein FRB94_006894 [Tulasnella sp. JGI-2019a]|nr:hypothetical protein FRB94_006894 [Tulasnella sp. JGI-2019a]KAG9005392.1 hypothetical protein FRB93_009696 [Tulasnella sp. JGI-2019a]KAG9029974.1 hypothetical protein FRB95_004677 [Tulasnella sp. JGI-2019a]